jgi:hypothetical protein
MAKKVSLTLVTKNTNERHVDLKWIKKITPCHGDIVHGSTMYYDWKFQLLVSTETLQNVVIQFERNKKNLA